MAALGVQHKALVKLMGLQFSIHYKQGPLNQAVDAMSRQHEDGLLLAISIATPTWMDNLQCGYADDPRATKLLVELSVLPPGTTSGEFTLLDGLLWFKGRIWVGANILAQNHILQALHSSGVGGHSGVYAIYHRVKQLIAWTTMKEDVIRFVGEYHICQRAKPEHVKTPGLLQPLPVPTKPWTVVSLGFSEGLPKSRGYDVILIIIDKFTKYGHFIPLADPFMALQVA
jgi:hypothetical protein